MPSHTHQNFVLLFRNHPQLAFELARRAGARLGDTYDRSEEVIPEFDNPLVARTVTADLALAGIVGGQPKGAVLIEVQLGTDLDKEWTVVFYRAGLRHRLRCPAWAIIFSPDPKVRAAFVERMFAREPELRPLIITPEMVPVPPSLGAAVANYAAAILAAAMHARGPQAVYSAIIVIRAVLMVAPREMGRYIQLVSASVGNEAMVQVREQLPEAEREQLSEWEREGGSFVLGREEGHAEGREEGREEGLRFALGTVLEARGLALNPTQQARLDTFTDVTQLRKLIARASTVAAVSELFD